MNSYAVKGAKQRKNLVWTGLALGVVFLLAAGSAYPQPWNKAMVALETKTGYHLPYLPETTYRLGLDLQGGAHLVYEADMASVTESDRADALQGVRDVVERRVNAFGVGEPTVQTTVTAGRYRIIVDLPGVSNVEDAIREIGETPVLTFRLPSDEVSFEASEEQQAQIDAAQATEREAALQVLDRALANDDWDALAKEASIDAATKEAGGYLGFLSEEDPEFGGLVAQINSQGLPRGVVDGLYEGTSRLHVMKYLARKTETEPKVSHLLVCFDGSTSCTNARSKEEAYALTQTIKDQATTKNFAELVAQYSDDAGSKVQGGSLDYISRGETVPVFEEAAYALRNGTISEIVESDFGYHLIYRETSRKAGYVELAHIEQPWTTLSDVFIVDPWKDTELSGRHVKHASVAFDQQTNQPLVVLDFNSEGADLFATLTAENVGNVIGIFLDGQAITTPTVQQAIYGGQATITGNFSVEEAKLLAQRLNAGALPVPISVVSQQTIGPALGQDSLDRSVQAGLAGFALIGLFMILYYRLPGFLAVLALAFYVAVNLALYKLFGVTITLSGIAGFVLSMGIAVDANVLIFERLKEELSEGRDLPSAVEEATRRAWPSIRDGNLTTLIATAVLYVMGTGSIRGFALTLTIGVLMSMFSALVVTHFLLKLVVRVRWLRKPLFFLGLPKSQE